MKIRTAVTATLSRRDWNEVLGAIERTEATTPLFERVRRKVHTKPYLPNRKTTIRLTVREAATFYSGFSSGRYLNTLEVYLQVVRIAKALGYPEPKERLPHVEESVPFIQITPTNFVSMTARNRTEKAA